MIGNWWVAPLENISKWTFPTWARDYVGLPQKNFGFDEVNTALQLVEPLNASVSSSAIRLLTEYQTGPRSFIVNKKDDTSWIGAYFLGEKEGEEKRFEEKDGEEEGEEEEQKEEEKEK